MKLSTFLRAIRKKKSPLFFREKNPVFTPGYPNTISGVKKELIGTTITEVFNDSFTVKKGKYLINVSVEQHEYTEDEEEDMTDEELCSFIISSVEVVK